MQTIGEKRKLEVVDREEEEEVPLPKIQKKTPLDLEEELKKKKLSQDQQAKPVFLSKKEREALALQRRAEEVERLEKLRKVEKLIKEQPKEEKDSSRRRSRSRSRSRSRDRESRRDRSRKERDSFRRRRSRSRSRSRSRDRDSRRDRSRREERDSSGRRRRSRSRSREKSLDLDNLSAEDLQKLTDKELEMIRKRYLGGPREKKKILKLSEKFKFNFEWDLSEDTSVELNPILEKAKSEIRPLFGRGYIGGIDHKEQDKETKKLDIDKLVGSSNTFHSHKKLTSLERAILPTRNWTEKSLEDMTDRDWRIFKEEFNITTRGGNIPNPIRYWKEASISKNILRALEKFGYKDPSPIQRQAIPVGLQGRDIIGIAETGSGKTAAFVIPMLEYIMKLPKFTPETALEGPYALIMAPTRELAQQIAQETERFANFCDIKVLSIVGGTAIEQQGFRLREGIEILIATPGRLADLVDSRYLVLNQCTYVVLDEADRMIDMGFEPQVNKVLDYMPSSHLKSEDEQEAAKQEGQIGKYRTTIMYSATMPVGVERLARKFLRRPAYVIIGEIGRAVERITQMVEWIRDQNEKGKRLLQLLNETGKGPIIVFVNKKSVAETLAKQLHKFGWRCTTLHSGRNQQAREASILGFKAGHYDILIATDVAGRGIDVPGVVHVINYDMPKSIEDYTHRIGRTGRAGLEGLATSFLTAEDTEIMYDLKKMLLDSGMMIPTELANHPSAQYKPGTIPDRKPRRDTIIYAVK